MQNNNTIQHKLTPREMEVLQLIITGCNCRQIADKLSIETDTVEKHRENLMRKLDAHNAIQLITIASSMNLTQNK